MIATLEGKIAQKIGDLVVIECGGVGYGLFVTFEDFGALNSGEPAKLFIYEHIRENTHDLFGFRNLETKFLFEQLLSVNGVGPKMALAILSVANASQVRKAIAAGDNPNDEALQGLVALGYSVQDASEALKDVDEKLSAPDRIKAALKA
jgi:Holliday junction DNA helicase RuvA